MNKLIYLIAIILLSACNSKRIYYVNSYHMGYPSSDQIRNSLDNFLRKEGLSAQTFYLNAKRVENNRVQQNADSIWKILRAKKPDILLVSDDNAVETLVVPHIQEMDFPIVFCGVNWSAEKYRLPDAKVTGMLEVLPVNQSLEAIRNSGYRAKSITIISEQSSSEKKNKDFLEPRFKGLGLSAEYLMVNNFEDWKSAFKENQIEGNIIFLPTNGGIANWNETAAIEFINENIRVPVFSCDDFMIKYCVFGLTKVASEQGNYMGEMTLKLLYGGKNTSDFNMVENTLSDCYLNENLANKIAFKLNTDLNCKKVEHAYQ